METTYFKLFGQKTAGKLVLVAVVDEDFLGSVPDQFELQAFKMPQTIYTGTYPDLKLNTDTIKDVSKECKGMGLAGIITSLKWYCKTNTQKDILGISIKR